MTEQIDNEDVFTPGQILRETRLEKGLELEQLSETLHIMPNFLRAIEDNEFDKITHGPTFAKGYLRSYANFLGVDPEPLVDAYEKMHAPVKKRSMKILPTKKVRKSIVVGESRGRKIVRRLLNVLVVIALLLGGYLLAKERGWLESSSPAPTSNVAPLKLTPEQPAPDLVDDQKANQPTQNEIIEATEVGEPVVADVEQQVPVIVKDQIIFELSDDSWIEVRDQEGDRLFADLARRGKTVELSGDAPFAIILGNGKAVSVSLNGRNVPFSYGRNNYAEFTAQ